MPALQDGFELLTEDFSIRAAYTPGDINQITAEEQWPVALDYAQRGTMARDALRAIGREDEKPWLRFVAPFNAMRRFGSMQRFTGLLEGLGYSLELESEESDGQISIHKTMRYPSVERANRIQVSVLGTNGLTAVRKEGGEFGAFESTAAFINEDEAEGQIWVATSPPYEVHDMAEHVLATLVMDRNLTDYLRTGWGKYLSRARAERKLPNIPVDMSDLMTFKFFHPCWAVIFDAAAHREDFTGRLSHALFFQSIGQEDNLQSQVSRSISKLRSNSNDLPGGFRYEDDALGVFPNIAGITQAIIQRCQQAERLMQLTPRL